MGVAIGVVLPVAHRSRNTRNVGNHASTFFFFFGVKKGFLTNCLLIGSSNLLLGLSGYNIVLLLYGNPIVKTKYFLLYRKKKSYKSYHNFNLILVF